MSVKQNIIFYSCGSDIIVDYIEVCLKNNVAIQAIIHNQEKKNTSIDSFSVNDYDFSKEQNPFLVPLFTPYNRFLAVREALSHQLVPYSLLSDSNNDLPIKFNHGVGCFINKRVVIGSESRIGNYVVINRGACLGHHLILEDFVSVGPGVVSGGGVTIKRGAMIGAGATLLPEITIGAFAIVGAGTVVTRDVSPNTIVSGNPAKQLKTNEIRF